MKFSAISSLVFLVLLAAGCGSVTIKNSVGEVTIDPVNKQPDIIVNAQLDHKK